MPASAGGKFLINGETVIDIRQYGLASIRFDILQIDAKSLLFFHDFRHQRSQFFIDTATGKLIAKLIVVWNLRIKKLHCACNGRQFLFKFLRIVSRRWKVTGE